MLLRSVIAAATLAGGVAMTATSADAARATADLSVRSGPGAGYARVDVIPRGAFVRVGRCARGGNWCRVNWRGRDGWSSAAYLRNGGPRRRAPSYRRNRGNRFVLDAPGFELRLGDKDRRQRRHRRGWRHR